MTDSLVQLQPFDEHNQKLQANVHPSDWVNPEPKNNYHLVVIGAGTAGLVTAAGAAGLGARVALIERELMGGDCLNVGCVPSKALIGPARIAAMARDSKSLGVEIAGSMKVDFAQVMQRMRKKRAHISPMDSAQRFAELGVDVFFGQGSFAGGHLVTVTRANGEVAELKFRKAVIASGARASAPPIKGLDSINYLTNENLFSLTELPKRFGVIGSGPIGCEMAQSFARFGSEVALFEMADRILPREDVEASAILNSQFERDGVNLVLNAADMELEPVGDQVRVIVVQNGIPKEVVVDQLLVAVGRAPNIDGLNLEAVSVGFNKRGIEVNEFMQTTNKKIYAAGDVCSKFQFTHSADFQARTVIQNALFALGPFGRKKASELIIPWATYTSPEIAHVGMYPQDAKDAGIEIDTYTQTFEHIDRAILEGREEGFAKVHTRKGTDRIVGATIVAENAGDLISEITVAMKNKVGLAGIGSTIHPYPTHADAIRRLGDQYNKTKLTPFSAKLLKFLMRLNVGS